MKSKSHIKWLNAGIFPCMIMFSVGYKYDEIITFLKRRKYNDWLAGLSDDKASIDSGKYFSIKRTVKNEKKHEVTLFYIIITRPFYFSDWDMCMLAHEVLHTCQFMLPDILNRDREFECEAYTHTHIMEQCLKIMRE